MGFVGDLVEVGCGVKDRGWEELLVRVFIGTESENILAGFKSL